MGNDITRKFCCKLTEAFKEQSFYQNAPLCSISEAGLISYIIATLDNKINKGEVQTLINSICLNTIANESKSEGKKEHIKERQLQSQFMIGSEAQSDIRNMFQESELKEPVAFEQDSVASYSRQRGQEFIIALVLLMDQSKAKSTKSFYQKIGEYLAQDSQEPEMSAALRLSSLLMDPGKLLKDERVSDGFLKMLTNMSVLSFYDWTKQSLTANRCLEHVRQSLLKEIKEEQVSGIPTCNLENVVKSLWHIGLLRGSIEDLLIAIDLMMELKIEIDFGSALNQILTLPKVLEAEIKSNLSDNIEYKVYFEQIYIDKSNWLIEKTVKLSSATDGKFVYFHNHKNGLFQLGTGNKTVKGKLYIKGEVAGADTIVGLVCLRNKLYCWNSDKLMRIDLNTMTLKESKKFSKVSIRPDCKVASSKDQLAVYFENNREESEDDDTCIVYSSVWVHDFDKKGSPRKFEISHHITDLHVIALYNDNMILASKKSYEVIDLENNIVLMKENTPLLEHATICCSDDFFIVYSAAGGEGFVLGKFRFPSLLKADVSLISTRLKNVIKAENRNMKKTVPKTEIASLLGIFDDSKSKLSDYESMNSVECLLAGLAYRANEVESFIMMADTSTAEALIKVYKTPVAVHLTTKCFITLFKLLNKFFCEAINAKAEEDSSIAFEKLCYIIIILTEHFIGLKKCSIPIKSLLAEDDQNTYDKICQEILIPISEKCILEKYHIKSDLIDTLSKWATKCFKYSSILMPFHLKNVIASIDVSFKMLTKEKKSNKDLEKIIDWLNVSENADMLAFSLVNANAESIELLDKYFSIESEHFCEMIESFVSKGIRAGNEAYDDFSCSFRSIIKKAFELLGKELLETDNDSKEVLLSALLTLFPKHLKRVGEKIKESYKIYKDSLINNLKGLIETNQLGIQYARYWEFIENLLRNEVEFFHCLSIVTTIILGLNWTPGGLMKVVRPLMKSANELKEILNFLAMEKANKETNILAKLERTLVNDEKFLKESIYSNEQYKFPKANGIHIRTLEVIDIPATEGNEITITASDKNKHIATLNKSNKQFNGIIEGNAVSIKVGVRPIKSELNLTYDGYKIRLIPKVHSYIIIVQLWSKINKRKFEEDNVDSMLHIKKHFE